MVFIAVCGIHNKKIKIDMIKKLYSLWPEPGLLVRLGALHATNPILQGVLLGMLIPGLRALLQPKPNFVEAETWLIAGGRLLVGYHVCTIIATHVGFTASIVLTVKLGGHVMRDINIFP